MAPFRRTKRKLGNTPTVCRVGHKHRSKLEASVCQILCLRVKAGEITEIIAESPVILSPALIKYVVDFKCKRPDGSYFYVEAKGHPDLTWSIKKKLWRVYGPGDLEIWRGLYTQPVMTEVIHVTTADKSPSSPSAA